MLSLAQIALWTYFEQHWQMTSASKSICNQPRPVLKAACSTVSIPMYKLLPRHQPPIMRRVLNKCFASMPLNVSTGDWYI